MGKDDSVEIKPEPAVDSGRSSPDHDVEKQSLQQGTTAQLQRRLQSRHLQMIAIGGTIGTGLFIGSGGAVAKSGPAGALIAYAFVGSLVLSVMQGMGEMATYMPVSGAFTVYASRFVDQSLGFSMGYIYFFSWAMTYALELTATGLIIQYWDRELSVSIFIGVFWVVITGINFLPVSFYGEIEFWFAFIKVVTVVGFIIFGICIDAGAGQHGYLGFETWNNPGAFAGYIVTDNDSLAKFVGFWAVLIQAGFSYQGTELVGIAAGETDNPRKSVPSAIRKTFWRILIFFVLTVFMIGLLIPYDNEQLLSDNTDASASPFVIAASLAGVKTLPGIINAVLLCVVLSAANANVYSGSRILVGLASEGLGPKFLTRTTNRGVPYYAVAVTAAFGLLGFMNESASGAEVFNWLINIVGVAGFISWTCIGVAHIAFMRACKAQGLNRDTLPYKAMWQPWFSWYGVCFNILIILTQGFTSFMPWNVSDFFVAYISVLLFVVLYVGHKLVTRCKFVRPEDVDLVSGVREVDEMYVDVKEEPKTLLGRVSSWVLG
jgi:yeast amino acid transporter